MDEDILSLTISRGLAEIILNRPAQLNAINCGLAEKLVEALSTIDRDPSVKVVLLKGAGRAFMAGGDLRISMKRVTGRRRGRAINCALSPDYSGNTTFAPSSNSRCSWCRAGGGLALALACDFVIASTDAVFTPAYLKIGTNPDGGTTWSVAKLLGERRALEWLMLGDFISAQQAASLWTAQSRRCARGSGRRSLNSGKPHCCWSGTSANVTQAVDLACNECLA